MTILNIIQVITAVLLMTAILLQSRGTGLGAAFGGEGNVYRTKRGLEKSLFRVTIVLAVIFLGTALGNTLLKTSNGITNPAVVPDTIPLETPTVAPTPQSTPAEIPEIKPSPKTPTSAGTPAAPTPKNP